jgi:hypothetical protein
MRAAHGRSSAYEISVSLKSISSRRRSSSPNSRARVIG